jgi:hypothetical protein
LPIYESILFLISGFSRRTDSACFKALLPPATPKFNFYPNWLPIIKVEVLMLEDKPFEQVLKTQKKSLIKKRGKENAVFPLPDSNFFKCHLSLT